MKYKILNDRYTQIENDIYYALLCEIENGTEMSNHIDGLKCLNVNVFDYQELVFINDRLTFLDCDGQHYSIDSECTNQDLLDILNKIE